MMFLQYPFIDHGIRIRILIVAPVQMPDRVQTMHTVKRGNEHRKVVFVTGDRNRFVDEAIGLGFWYAHDGAWVEFHPFGVGFVGVSHVFCFLVTEARAEDFGFVFYDVLGGGCV
jgi:hypothetical protein